MDRERRNRREESVASQERAALLSKIAQRRAEKGSVAAAAIAHASALPESDSETEVFVETEESTSDSVIGGGASHDFTAAEPSGDGLSDIVGTLGGLSLDGSTASASGSGSRSVPWTSAAQGGTKHYDVPVKQQQVVELSSDDEDAFQSPVQKGKADVRKVRAAVQDQERGQESDFEDCSYKSCDEDQGGKTVDADLVLGEGNERFLLSGKIAGRLYPHQQVGIRWLWSLHLKQMGGILGDDMGLGKTMQMSAFFAGLFQSKLIRTAMVVAPKTLISHWIKELANVGLSRKTQTFVDMSPRVRNSSLQKVLQMGGVLLTTYDMVRCNYQVLRGDVHGRDGYGENGDDITTWDYIVLDEGHLIKNPLTERSKRLRELPSGHRIILSGTPIQNNLKEMWALMDFCCPGLLGDKKEFKDKYEKQIVDGTDKHASDRMKRLGSAVAQELRLKLAPFFLRRMKSEVFPEEAEGPKLSRKNDFIVWLKLSARQAQLYMAFLESEAVSKALMTKNALTALSIADGLQDISLVCNHPKPVLKKICDHPSLLTKRAADDIAEGMEGMMGSEDRAEAEAMAASLSGSIEDDSEINVVSASCKIVFLFILLEKLFHEGHRTLIFSQTRKMLNIIQDELEARGWDYRRVDGTFKSSERAVAVDDFQSNMDIPFFLLTSQVGGLGLTLTGADRVVIIDPAWNPSVDNQSVDRAYRIGQTKDVAVYRLMTCGTIEEKIYRKQVFKGGLMKVATETKNQMRYFSQGELRDLFIVPKTGFTVSATQKQLEEEHFGEHQTSKGLEEHIRYLEGLSMIAGVSHHDLLYSKAAPPLPAAADNEDDTQVSWESRNMAHRERHFKPASQVRETYTWDPANAAGEPRFAPASAEISDEAKHAWFRVSFLQDKIRRLAAMLEDEATVSKLVDGGAKIVKKIKELNGTIEELKPKAAAYEATLSSTGNGLQRGGNNHDAGAGRLQVLGEKNSPEDVVGLGVRSSSANNIDMPRVGTDLRKSPASGGATERGGVENLGDVMSALRV